MKNFLTPRSGLLCAAAFAALSLLPSAALAQYDFSGYLPPGVTINNATPQQITEAVAAAVKADPAAAAEIAGGSLRSVYDAGRYTLPGSQDGKQSADPDGSSSDPSLEEWAGAIADAAKTANPDPTMAPKIDAAVAKTLTSFPQVAPPGGGTTTDGGGVPPPAIPPGGGGGTTTSSTGASN